MAERRLRRWSRRALIGVALVFLTLTFASLILNRVTTPADRFAAPSGQDVRVGTTRVHYERWGDSGTPVVLIGGFAESSVSWSPMAPKLARNHVVYAVDLAGYGYTDYTGRYTLADQTGLVSGFITALHLDRPVVVGHSLGAAVVGSLALQHPEQIAGVIFADGDALPFVNGKSARPPKVVLESPYVTSLYRLGTRWSWLDEKIVRSQCGSVCRGYSDELVQAWMRPLRQGDAERAMLATASQPMLHLSPEQIRAIRVSRGIIWGEQDATGGGSLASTRTNLGQPPTVILPGAAHLSMVADPAGFAAAVDSIIARAEMH